MESADLWKLPPIEKIPEAYGAIADGRVAMKDSSADVVSSDGTKNYRLRRQRFQVAGIHRLSHRRRSAPARQTSSQSGRYDAVQGNPLERAQ